MPEESNSFPAGIDFESILRIISQQIYETPLAFIRENVQNAVDAIRIQAHREGSDPDDDRYRIEIVARGQDIIVQDNGVGMTARDLQNFFWTIGASGKRTPEALAAGCVGTFGIGGFANFGVCDSLEVISQTEAEPHGTLTRLSEADIQAAGTAIPSVTMDRSDRAGPRGTIVVGHLREPAKVDEVRGYLQDFVKFVSTTVRFNGETVSKRPFSNLEDRENLTEISGGVQQWREGDLVIRGHMYEDRGHALVTSIEGMNIRTQPVGLSGQLRFENGTIDVFKRGFKLCATQIGSTIGVSGRLDCDRFAPTAGRDSVDAATTALLSQIV
ncbi:MAG: ATP-binding protein, partial [Spirochaetes bacterium]|nr:ATP-binding protein [Spirochaetota bacterium]